MTIFLDRHPGAAPVPDPILDRRPCVFPWYSCPKFVSGYKFCAYSGFDIRFDERSLLPAI